MRRAIQRRVTRKVPGANYHDVEDATSTAVMNLFAVWRNYEGTLRVVDQTKLYAFAVVWGQRRAMQYLAQAMEEQSKLVYFDRHPQDNGNEVEDHSIWDQWPSGEPGPEDLALAKEERRLARDLIAASPEAEERWLRPLLNGEGVREQARRERRDPKTIHEGRKRVVNNCRRRALERGWVA